MSKLRGLVIGAGYFSQFHFEAWSRMDDVELVGVCDVDQQRATEAARKWSLEHIFQDASRAIEELKPDFIDIVTRPDTHLELVRRAASHRIPMICQKPLAPTYSQAHEIVCVAKEANTPLMVHENFRFQPWYREIKRLLDGGQIGSRLHNLYFRARPGDGWGPDAYLSRQPYFREMPRLLVHETGVHFIDTFRFLAGEVTEVYAILRRLNPVIQGEDAALLTMQFASGAVGVWDANRYNETTAADPRYTFGQLLVEADGGCIRLDEDGNMFLKLLGRPEEKNAYEHSRQNFSGDCVYTTQRHFIEGLRSGRAFETSGAEYLRTLAVQEAAYQSHARKQPVAVDPR